MSIACIYPTGHFLRFDRTRMSGSKEGDSAVGNELDSGARSSAPVSDHADAFDHWLSEKLVLLYDPVLREPIPEHLIELIEAHRHNESS